MRISDWSSDVCSSDLFDDARHLAIAFAQLIARQHEDNGPYGRAGERRDQEWTKGHPADPCGHRNQGPDSRDHAPEQNRPTTVAVEPAVDMIDLTGRQRQPSAVAGSKALQSFDADPARSEEHTSELQSLMRISYAVFCLKKKT